MKSVSPRWFALFVVLLSTPTVGLAADLPRPLAPPFRKVWLAKVAGYLSDFFVVNDTEFYAASAGYGAIDLKTGQKRWVVGDVSSWLVQVGNVLYVTVEHGPYPAELRACNPADGTTTWSCPLPGAAIRCAGDASGIYCFCVNGDLVAIDRGTHQVRWRLPLGFKARGNYLPLPPGVGSQPEVGTELASGAATQVEASGSTFDDGEEVAEQQVQRRKSERALHESVSNMNTMGAPARPVIVGDRLIVALDTGRVVAVRYSDGKALWDVKVVNTESSISGVGQAVDGEYLYVNFGLAGIYALRCSDGGAVWSDKTPYKSRQPVVAMGVLLVEKHQDMITALRLTDGQLAWQCPFTRALGSHLDHERLLHVGVVTQNLLLVRSSNGLAAVDRAGKLLWEWSWNSDRFGPPIAVGERDFLLADDCHIRRFTMGQPPGLPKQQSARRLLALQMAMRFRALDDDESAELAKLGDHAFAALLPLWPAYAVNDDGDSQKLWYILLHTMRPAFTGDVLRLYKSLPATRLNDDAHEGLRQLMMQRGDARAVPTIVASVRSRLPNIPEMLTERYLEYILDARTRETAALLTEIVLDPQAPEEWRDAAMTTVGALSDAGARAVLKVRRERRAAFARETYPPIESRLRLDALGDKPGEDSALYRVGRDAQGTEWGLFTSGWVGADDDSWLVRRRDGQWVEPVFIGNPTPDRKAGLPEDWPARFGGDRTLFTDSDGDGWTNRLEERLGTDPHRSDTDGDGVADSKDRNPLAAPRALGDVEQILAAAFEVRYWGAHAGGRIANPFLVMLPPGVAPFEFPFAPWVVLVQPSGVEPPATRALQAVKGHGLQYVRFTRPFREFKGREYKLKAGDSSVILWNSDHTVARVALDVYYGNLGADGRELTLRKIDGEWVVTSYATTYVS